MTDRKIAIIGLGYVGLPVAMAFARHYPGTIGYDISEKRVSALRNFEDWTNEVAPEELKAVNLTLTSSTDILAEADVFIVCVPTPVHADHRPDLDCLKLASETVGKALRKGGTVIYESTVYPGLTEEFCGKILASASGLRREEFSLGYSPERINPGDKEHSFETIVKVVSGDSAATAELVAQLYGSVVRAGVHVAPSIKVAEAAKVLENTQRDLNIALMNELAIICDLMDIRTRDVLAAARTKWNFLKFEPGLVGGHCIGVDPYYLTSKAQELGYHPEVILAGRRINDSMGAVLAKRLVQLLAKSGRTPASAKVGILGVTFKENVPDTRNSKIPSIADELRTFGINAIINDPLAAPSAVVHEYGIDLAGLENFRDLDALILAVPHLSYLEDRASLCTMLQDGGILIDVKSVLDPVTIPHNIVYWCL